MADSCGGGDGGNNGIEGFVGAELLFGEAPLCEVFGLVSPFLEMDVPELVEIDFGVVGVEEVFDIGDGGFARGIDVAVDVLFVISMGGCGSLRGRGWTYSASVCGVDTVDHVHCKVVLIRSPRDDVVAVLCQCVDDGVYSPKDWRVRKDLYLSTTEFGELFILMKRTFPSQLKNPRFIPPDLNLCLIFSSSCDLQGMGMTLGS